MKKTSLEIDDALAAQLESAAKARGISTREFIRGALQHALKEHQEVKDLIARVPHSENLDGTIEAIKTHVLHHVEEERRGMFAKARASGMELATLAGRIQTRRAEVADAIQAA